MTYICHPISSKRDSFSLHPQLKRLTRSRLLLNHIRDGMLCNNILTDEKLFLVQQSHNHQNDRVLARTLEAIPGNVGKFFGVQKSTSVMIWTAISKRGKSSLVFVPQGVKINKECCIEDILESALIPWCNSVYSEIWTFQQDGATSHTA